MAKPSGFILYRGPSLLDGAPIVVISTHSSKNAKTGGMVQTWILREDIAPTAALKSGADVSICGQCPHRPALGGACYVTVFQAPLAVWKAYKRGRYPALPDGAPYAGRMVRLGSYGDPAAAPLEVWDRVTAGSAGTTGYTHQWTVSDIRLSKYCMASCDTPADRASAKHAGYRTFRIRLQSEDKHAGEVICPASVEGGSKLNCNTCGHCNGRATGRKGDVVIIAHGAASKVKAYVNFRSNSSTHSTI